MTPTCAWCQKKTPVHRRAETNQTCPTTPASFKQNSRPLRITDKLNTPYPGGPGPGTVADTTFGLHDPLRRRPRPHHGLRLRARHHHERARARHSSQDGRRAVWQLGQVRVFDGGSDADGSTTADNTVFAVQGVFVP